MAPLPKPLELRQRRNKSSTAAKIDAPALVWPRLPAGRKWHVRVRKWWKLLSEGPTAKEYLDSDMEGLFILADLMHRYWVEKDPDRQIKLALAIVRHRSSYGDTPIDRRRLQWSIQREGGRGGTAPREEPTPIARARDPRKALLA